MCAAHLLSILPGRAVADSKTAADEIILHIHNDKSGLGLYDLRRGFFRKNISWLGLFGSHFCHPFLETIAEFLVAHTPVSRGVKDIKYICNPLCIEPKKIKSAKEVLTISTDLYGVPMGSRKRALHIVVNSLMLIALSLQSQSKEKKEFCSSFM